MTEPDRPQIKQDKRRVLEYLQTSRKFMPYLHASMPAHGAVKLLGSRDRAQRALTALVQDGKIRYLENCSPDHYQAYAEVSVPDCPAEQREFCRVCAQGPGGPEHGGGRRSVHEYDGVPLRVPDRPDEMSDKQKPADTRSERNRHPDTQSAPDAHPDLIDGDGGRWAWDLDGYRTRPSSTRTWTRGEIEHHWPPVVEAGPAAEQPVQPGPDVIARFLETGTAEQNIHLHEQNVELRRLLAAAQMPPDHPTATEWAVIAYDVEKEADRVDACEDEADARSMLAYQQRSMRLRDARIVTRNATPWLPFQTETEE